MTIYFHYEKDEYIGKSNNLAIAKALIESDLKAKDLEEIAKYLTVYTNRYKDAKMVVREEMSE